MGERDSFEPHSESNQTRIDSPHELAREEVPKSQPARKRRKAETVAARSAAKSTQEPPAPSAPCYVAETPDLIPEIVVRHADDLSEHLAMRLREIEQREVALAALQANFEQAEATARAWVAEKDIELTARERDVQLREDEVATRAAATAAAEIASEERLKAETELLNARARELDEREAKVSVREEQLRSEQQALVQATDRLNAERRRAEELHRARQQKWDAVVLADRAQAERAMLMLQKYRLSLDERERSLAAREVRLGESDQRLTATICQPQPKAKEHAAVGLAETLLRVETTKEHRAAIEQRWIATRLWSKLTESGLLEDEELSASLKAVRKELEVQYRREKQALEEAGSQLLNLLKRMQPRRESSRSSAMANAV